MCRLLVDTNIMLDAAVRDRPENPAARELLDRCNGWGDFGMACALSLKDVYYITGRGKGERFAREAVRALMGLLTIVPVDAEVCDIALHSDEPDFEDGLIRACAELNGADYIITRDKDAFAGSKIKALSAAEYLERARARDTGRPRRRRFEQE